jgi:hypothetical protein
VVQNWGKELRHWLGDRVEPVVVDDTKADQVWVGGVPLCCLCWPHARQASSR